MKENQNLISVVGQGVLSLMPDQATVSLSFDRLYHTSEDAYREAARNSAMLDSVLQACGIPADRARTTFFLISKSYEWVSVTADGEEKTEQRFNGFDLNQRVEIKLSADIALLSVLCARLSESNRLETIRISYSIADPKSYKLRVLEAAVSDAAAKAATIVRAAGCRLGDITSIDYGNGRRTMPSFHDHVFYCNSFACRTDSSAPEASDVNLTPEAQELTETVNMSWAILQS